MTGYELLALSLGEGFLLIMLALVVWIGARGERRLFWQVMLSLALTLILVYILKYFFPHQRPYVTYELPLLPGINVGPEGSFPSAHAALAFALASIVWDQKHRWGILLLLMAVLVAVGRVMLLVHFPSDVIAGGLIGFACAIVTSRLLPTKS